MSLGGPNVYPGVLSWLGIARELTVGTTVNPVITHPLEQGAFEPEDTPKFLKDQGIRGAMTDVFYETLGVESAVFSFGGPNYLDSHGYFFDNLFGDLSTTCNTVITPSTVSGTVPVGAISMTLSAAPPAGYTAGAYLQIGNAVVATTPGSYLNEVVLVSGTAASNVVNFATTPVRFAHPAAIIPGSVVTGSSVVNIASGTQFTHRFASLNSQLGYGGAFGAQPPTHTFTDVTNIVSVFSSATLGTAPTNAFGARMYPSAVLKSIDIAGNAEQLMGIKMAGDSWLSTAATSAVTNTTTNVRPIPNWNTSVVVAGYTIGTTTNFGSGAPSAYGGIGEFSISFKRATQVYWVVAGTQTPMIIARGPLSFDGSMQWDPTNSEMPLDLMLMNAQGPTVINMTNTGIPNSGTGFSLTFTASQLANVKSKIMRNKALIGYANSFEAIANTTDIGGSGGNGPGVLTLVNGTPTYDATNWMVNEGITPRGLHFV